MENVNLEIVNGTSKKTGIEYTALKLSIGEWSQLIFPRSKFELKYIEELLNA